MAGRDLRLDGVTKAFGSFTAVDGVSLDVPSGSFFALLGPSGCGKTTTLRMIAGLETPSSGRIVFDGRDLVRSSAFARNIGMVFQSYALFPHMTVADNVAFGLRARRRPRAETRTRVGEALDQVGMGDYARRLPRELSGGQQQRVAIARALAVRPPLLLLDEPLSALDARLRESMLTELQQLRAALPDTAMLYVTHDQTEALALADRIGVMRDARLVDLGPARHLWDSPPTAFTANFLGGATLLPATVDGSGPGDGDRISVRIGAGWVQVAPGPGQAWQPGDAALLAVRPHAVRIAVTLGGSDTLAARVATAQWRGSATRLELHLDGLPDVALKADVPAEMGVRAGQEVGVVLGTTSLVPAPAEAAR